MKKKELIQVRCSTSEKEQIKRGAEKSGLTMSNYILRSLEKDEFTLSLFGRFEEKIESFSNRVESSLYLIKEDTEKVLEDRVLNKRGMKLVNILDSIKEKYDLRNYKIYDLLTYKNGKTYMVQFNDFEEEIHVQNIETGTVGHYKVGDKGLNALIEGLTEVQRRV